MPSVITRALNSGRARIRDIRSRALSLGLPLIASAAMASTVIASAVFASSGHAQTAPPIIGHVKTVQGTAWVGPPGALVPAQVGTPIHVGATLRTEAGAALGITLKDDTVMSFGPDTELRVDEYLFDPARGDLKFTSSMLRGSLNFISGLIAKLRPEAQEVRTPLGVIGVRGTHFLIRLGD